MNKVYYLLQYGLFRFCGWVLASLPHAWIVRLGVWMGSCAYHLHRPFRKKALSNLAIAYGESKTEHERTELAKRSFHNLMITCLEFFKLKKGESLGELISLTAHPILEERLQQGKPIVFLSGHQANWEVAFLALTERYKGVAIGRPVKNPWLYKWILSVRESYGGRIVTPKNAIRAGLKALNEGQFVGIVGDQAYPNSSYCYPLFGTRAWTATTPALLAYKTAAPLVVGTTRRHEGKYQVAAAEVIWPDLTRPMKEETTRMMDLAMRVLETSITECPEQWLWVHDRWKQQGVDHVKRPYRYSFLLIVFPENPEPILELLPLLRLIYPWSFFTLLLPKGTSSCKTKFPGCSVYEYRNEEELYLRDWRFQLILDFYGSRKMRRYYLNLGAFKAPFFPLQSKKGPLSVRIKRELVKSECLMTVSS